MKQLARGLHNKYFLDKYMFPLREKLFNELRQDNNYKSINNELIQDIILDITEYLKPTYNQVKKDQIEQVELKRLDH